MKTCQLTMKFMPAGLGLLLALLTLDAAGQDADDLFADEVDTRAINEGELRLLSPPPTGTVHGHSNRISLTAGSLRDGWAQLYQCHTGLDRVPAAQIVYRPGSTRKLAVVSSDGIGRVRVEGVSIQLEDITGAARLCIRAESRVVRRLPGNRFVVRNGPFMRRFLDGYYPMHVTLEILLPPGDWILERSVPATAPGFSVTRLHDSIRAEAWFEGKLETAFYFRPATRRPRAVQDKGRQAAP